MKRSAKLACAVVLTSLLTGCLANLGVRVGHSGVSATQPSVGPGSSFSSGGLNLSITDGSFLGGLFTAAGLGALFGMSERRAPELDPTRRVNEQDCSRALQDTEGNLRCR
jgi:hypothetical protein